MRSRGTDLVEDRLGRLPRIPRGGDRPAHDKQIRARRDRTARGLHPTLIVSTGPGRPDARTDEKKRRAAGSPDGGGIDR